MPEPDFNEPLDTRRDANDNSHPPTSPPEPPEEIDRPVSGPTFYRANHDEMTSGGRSNGNPSLAERMARGERVDSLIESAHNSMATYTEEIRNNAMNNLNRNR